MNQPNSQPDNGQANNEQQGHPAWQEILSAVPDEFHPLLTPKLKEWDTGVQNKIQSLHDQYGPYKQFIDNNIDAELIEEALGLVNAVQNEPDRLAQDLIEHFELDFVPKGEVQQNNNNQQETEMNPYDDDFDITDHPQFKAMKEVVDEFQNRFKEQDEERERLTAQEEIDKELAELAETNGEFDKLFVTTLMANGMTGEQAVKQFQDTVNQAAAKIANPNQTTSSSNDSGDGSTGYNTGQNSGGTQAPVVMGADGTSGSGLPEEGLDLGTATDQDVKQLIANMLNTQQNS